MRLDFSRRHLLALAGAGAAAPASRVVAQQAPPPVPALPIKEYKPRSKVVLVHGEDRRKNVYESLLALDAEIAPRLRRKKYVVIKPNDVNVVNQLSCTHADALRGILDYLAPRYKGPVTIAESSAGNTWTGFENFGYPKLAGEYKSLKVELVDLDIEGKYTAIPALNRELHVVPMRLAARLLDPDAFIICATCLKAHNYVVATMSVKNMVVGAAIKSSPKSAEKWSDKRLFHTGHHVGNYNMLVTAQALLPYWGVTVIDGYEGMEGDGPMSGTPVPSRLAIASTDFIAADRVGVDCMGLDPRWVGYLQYCGQAGLGNYDLAKIDLEGPPLAAVRRKFRLHSDVERQLQWMAPAKVVVGEV